MITIFLTEHRYSASNEIERSLSSLFWIYIKGRFFSDLITLVPFFQLFSEYDLKYRKLVFLIKLLRLRVGFSLLDYKRTIGQIKEMYMKRLTNLIDKDSFLAES